MKNKIWKVCIIAGTMLILSALFLCLYNFRESSRAFESSQKVLAELVELIPEKPDESGMTVRTDAQKNDIFAPYEEQEEETPLSEIEVDGRSYCGYITLPSLGIELPVMSSWSYPNLKLSPCRYSGDPRENNLIIAAHNYNSHFGRIKELNSGDEIVFTACDGSVYRYTVDFTEYVDGGDVEKMLSGSSDDWDITLFTCTLSGQSRVTVRGISAEK